MIHKLISKSQVRLLEYEGNPSQDYKDGYCRAIHDVLDLEPIPTLGADEYEKYKADYEARLKADMVTMLTDISHEIQETEKVVDSNLAAYWWKEGIRDSVNVIQGRINILKAVQEKGNKDGKI